ncbi:MAG: ABC transporter permease [Ruminococcaceae bacterium]|nr:ABC transporter permease [Oscillospiraceae bacterium]
MLVATIIKKSVEQGIPLLFGSTGEILTEKSGNLNLGIPGIMYVGGSAGILGAYLYENAVATPNPLLCVLIPLIASLIGSTLLALIYSFLTITLRANQNVTGLALTTFGVGFGDFFGGSLTKIFGNGGTLSVKLSSDYFKTPLPFAKSLGWFGEIFFSYGFLAYVAIIVALISAFVLKRTRVGLHLRAVGENPATADAAGISVTKYKYLATCIGGAIAGLGGLYFIMDYTGGAWTNGGFGDRGWLAIALVIFALWRPNIGILGSIVFGGLYIAYSYISGLSRSAIAIFNMLPYVVTILILVLTSVRNKKETQPPEHLGLPYFREER